MTITSARTLLFVPADDVRKVERAWQAGADALILDLEDSVALDAKAAARARLADLAGRDHAERLARSPGVVRMMLGPFDLTAELSCEPGANGWELLLSRSQLVLASAAAGISAPIDGPFTKLDDVGGLRAESERARRLGFTGKACIHPRQLPEVAARLAPRPEQVDWARRVIAAYSRAGGGGVLALDGQMIDEPIARRALAVLAVSEEGR